MKSFSQYMNEANNEKYVSKAWSSGETIQLYDTVRFFDTGTSSNTKRMYVGQITNIDQTSDNIDFMGNNGSIKYEVTCYDFEKNKTFIFTFEATNLSTNYNITYNYKQIKGRLFLEKRNNKKLNLKKDLLPMYQYYSNIKSDL